MMEVLECRLPACHNIKKANEPLGVQAARLLNIANAAIWSEGGSPATIAEATIWNAGGSPANTRTSRPHSTIAAIFLANAGEPPALQSLHLFHFHILLLSIILHSNLFSFRITSRNSHHDKCPFLQHSREFTFAVGDGQGF